MEQTTVLQNISVESIFPNPDNPRKDLGDLSELTESIKANGILQNLTVVPWPEYEGGGDGKYLAVIGHRRHAAAKLAGLDTVPCMVTDMDRKTQVSTMMLENLERNDLTIYEQAQGFQLMLDLGDSVKSIATRTGFSETTVRSRLKLKELDDKGFKKATERGATLFDFGRLSEIKDIDKRNNVLKHIGTNNFEYQLGRAKDEERCKEIKDWLTAQLDTFAQEVSKRPDKAEYIRSYSFYGCRTVEDMQKQYSKPDDVDARSYYYTVDANRGIYVYADAVEKQPTPEDLARQKEQEEREARVSALSAVADTIRGVHHQFIRSVSKTKLKKSMIEIAGALVNGITDCYVRVDIDDIAEVLGEDPDALPKSDDMERYIFAAAYCLSGGDSMRSTWNWKGEYREDDSSKDLYDLIIPLGYVMSDDEKALMDGTHELYLKMEPEIPEEIVVEDDLEYYVEEEYEDDAFFDEEDLVSEASASEEEVFEAETYEQVA